ncbi:hypothetical protein [Methanolobus vulcani]|jgi:hypothetical protein|uniref:Uncharacterized protein n=1 Tax=Methanolobus vulcani TaxID=38026 RepID=A0A7Z8P1F5_9EURY|nr:hypothetical protein [Methanolobus vulcani]TQD23557.1 hypothetical protein FKV42_13630 [Methanolobus vulcani]
MKLDQKDKDRIVSIVASRYFSEQGWKWIDLNADISKIHKAHDDLRDQYAAYPYMSRDWYVSNSATKSTHMCENWEELSELVEFLNAYGHYFDFLVKDSRKSLCIASTDGNLSHEEKTAISAARRSRYNVFVFRVDVPEDIDFELMQIGGGM